MCFYVQFYNKKKLKKNILSFRFVFCCCCVAVNISFSITTIPTYFITFFVQVRILAKLQLKQHFNKRWFLRENRKRKSIFWSICCGNFMTNKMSQIGEIAKKKFEGESRSRYSLIIFVCYFVSTFCFWKIDFKIFFNFPKFWNFQCPKRRGKPNK